jgi:hypothetical protein
MAGQRTRIFGWCEPSAYIAWLAGVVCGGSQGRAILLAASQPHERVPGQVVHQRNAVGTGEVHVLGEAWAWFAEVRSERGAGVRGCPAQAAQRRIRRRDLPGVRRSWADLWPPVRVAGSIKLPGQWPEAAPGCLCRSHLVWFAVPASGVGSP